MSFPDTFLFGSATSAYQIEGAAAEDGRAPSWWDTFSKKPGATKDGKNGDDACDHYHAWKNDIDIMVSLNLRAYRFSISWPRVLPRGRGRINSKGLDFYDRLVDALLERGIKPFVTLYHWDLPQTLADEGGWLNRDCAKSFVEYADAATRRLGDRVFSWATLNEPRCASVVGYVEGRHAPGVEGRRDQALQAAHVMLLGHGYALPVIRANAPGAKVGIVLDVKPYYPGDDSESSRDAARRADGVFNRWFLDAVFKGGYPEDIVEGFKAQMPDIESGDMKAISGAIDTLGLNYYSRGVVKADEGVPFPSTQDIKQSSAQHTAMEWEVYPEGLSDILERIHKEYRVKDIFIAENGAAFQDELQDEHVHDSDRTSYFKRHIAAAAKAMERGVPVSAYFAWSLLDNFEWGQGYTKRFGIVYVDYPTQKRIPKDSALWYRDFIASR